MYPQQRLQVVLSDITKVAVAAATAMKCTKMIKTIPLHMSTMTPLGI